MKKRATSPLGIVLILIAAALTSIAQFIWKLGALFSGPQKIILMFVGVVLFVADGFFMVIAYRFGELSVLQPILSLGFVFSLVLGKFFLHEVHTVTKYLGIVLILAGVFYLSQSIVNWTDEMPVDEESV
ncbi:MAG: EamA family transporter [Treponema sp.]|uniref:EamA family transporter n=1 Tax=Treponema sp. TaxID=166 RepID=UPI001B7BA0D1|nr:EamA family transporter [Treponema sp.]MBP5401984.1 EamA family transporter [Treponema sp.]MBR5933323.1 EamA family transporter [Treponema sp.]